MSNSADAADGALILCAIFGIGAGVTWGIGIGIMCGVAMFILIGVIVSFSE